LGTLRHNENEKQSKPSRQNLNGKHSRHHDAKKSTIQDHKTTKHKSIPLKGEQELMAGVLQEGRLKREEFSCRAR